MILFNFELKVQCMVISIVYFLDVTVSEILEMRLFHVFSGDLRWFQYNIFSIVFWNFSCLICNSSEENIYENVPMGHMPYGEQHFSCHHFNSTDIMNFYLLWRTPLGNKLVMWVSSIKIIIIFSCRKQYLIFLGSFVAWCSHHLKYQPYFCATLKYPLHVIENLSFNFIYE